MSNPQQEGSAATGTDVEEPVESVEGEKKRSIGWWNWGVVFVSIVLLAGYTVSSLGAGNFELGTLLLVATFLVGLLTLVVNSVALIVCMILEGPGGLAAIFTFVSVGGTVYKKRTYGDNTGRALWGFCAGLILLCAGVAVLVGMQGQ